MDVGVPVFFVQGANPGVRAGGGVQWDPLRHFGVFAMVGGAYFFSPPPGIVHGVFVPSLGVHARL